MPVSYLLNLVEFANRIHWKEQLETDSFQTVAQLTDAIKSSLNVEFGDVFVVGEVSGLTRPQSGHIYFTLKDDASQISTIIWRSSAARLAFQPEEGTKILCRGYIDVYPQRGSYQLIARVIQPIGEGSLQVAFRKLHARLKQEGLFDDRLKKTLPKIPKRIVLITSPSGAAIHDFLQVATRRWPNLEILVVPVQVQGPESAGQIANALRWFGDREIYDSDVIVVTRGGGSIEDLWSFNEEAVVRAIYDCQVPVISAVGHEIDVTLSDLVADVRALTPSEAGEKLVPDAEEIRHRLGTSQTRLSVAIENKLAEAKSALKILLQRQGLKQPLEKVRQLELRLDSFESRLRENSLRKFEVAQHKLKNYLDRLRLALGSLIPKARSQLDRIVESSSLSKPLLPIQSRKEKLATTGKRLVMAIERILERRRNELQIQEGKLQAFNPAKVLDRGYSLTLNSNGQPITDCQSVRPGDTILTHLAVGKLQSVVENTEGISEKENGKEKENHG